MGKKQDSLSLKKSQLTRSFGSGFLCIGLGIGLGIALTFTAGIGCGSKPDLSPTTAISTQSTPADPAKDGGNAPKTQEKSTPDSLPQGSPPAPTPPLEDGSIPNPSNPANPANAQDPGLLPLPNQTQPSEKTCGLRQVQKEFVARPFSPTETSNLPTLPYRSTEKDPDRHFRHALPILPLAGRTGITSNAIPYVRDSQVLFAFDLTDLPPKEAIISLEKAELVLGLTKISHDSSTSTELLCFLDERVCSGELFEDKFWKKNINPAFFGGKPPVNNFFAQQFLDHQVGSLDKDKLYSATLTLKLSDLISGSSFHDVLDFTYSGLPSNLPVSKRVLKLEIADDTFVSKDSALRITLIEDTCRTLSLTQPNPK